jgi:hypothetical protein
MRCHIARAKGELSSPSRGESAGAHGALPGGERSGAGTCPPYLLGGVALLAAGLLGVRLLSQRRDASTGPAGGGRTTAAR